MAANRRHPSGILWAAAVVAIVGGIVAAGWRIHDGNGQSAATSAPTTEQTVKVGHDYYLFVRLVEFAPRTPKGKKWDSGNGTAPDARVRLTWRGNRMFKLPERKDQLINTWDLFRVDVKDLIVGGGTADVSSMISGPIVRVEPNESVTVEVWDDEFMGDDLALRMNVPLTGLREGRNDIAVPPGSGVVRLRIDMLSTSTPLADLVQWQTGGK